MTSLYDRYDLPSLHRNLVIMIQILYCGALGPTPGWRSIYQIPGPPKDTQATNILTLCTSVGRCHPTFRMKRETSRRTMSNRTVRTSIVRLWGSLAEGQHRACRDGSGPSMHDHGTDPVLDDALEKQDPNIVLDPGTKSFNLRLCQLGCLC